MSDVFVGRQAIYDQSLKVVGYELLFRASEFAQTAEFLDHEQASFQVILDTFLDIGIERMVGNTPAFLNLTRNFFVSAQTVPFPRDRVVLELLEDQIIDEPLIESLRSYSQAGYRIALDDFVFSEEARPLVELADIVKLDVLANTEEQLRQQVEILQPYDLILLAEKVEDHQQFEACKAMGFHFFQGFFLCKPSVVKGQKIPANRFAILRLLAKLQDPQTEMGELEEIIRQDLSLSYKLLRLINSAFYGLPTKIESIRQTLVLLGIQQIRSWISLLTLVSMDDKAPDLVNTAMIRAKMCENLAVSTGQPSPDVFFTVGLFSALDAILDMPMEDILSSLPLSADIESALLSRSGTMGEAIRCVQAYEKGEWENVGFAGLEPEAIRTAYLDALGWSGKAGRELGL